LLEPEAIYDPLPALCCPRPNARCTQGSLDCSRKPGRLGRWDHHPKIAHDPPSVTDIRDHAGDAACHALSNYVRESFAISGREHQDIQSAVDRSHVTPGAGPMHMCTPPNGKSSQIEAGSSFFVNTHTHETNIISTSTENVRCRKKICVGLHGVRSTDDADELALLPDPPLLAHTTSPLTTELESDEVDTIGDDIPAPGTEASGCVIQLARPGICDDQRNTLRQ